MDSFYRLVRRESGILMRDGKPVGGKFSFDTESRTVGNTTGRASNERERI
jgi:deoxyribodipyrimidine photolyase-related protein